MERTSEWIFSLDIPSDVTVHAAGVPFSLHKIPLLSKSGYMRHMVIDTEKAVILLPDVPGGAEGFELAAKFCYGIHFNLTPENVATVRCVAEFLDMSEKYAAYNLVQRTECYINEVAVKTLPAAISMLHDCENFLSIAEKVKLVSRCIDAIAYLSCKEHEGQVTISISNHQVVEWWAEDFTKLRVDIFQRVLVAMMSRGFKPAALGPILALYAQKSLCCLDTYGIGARKIEPELAKEKQDVVETITSLLPREKNAASASLISMLLRASILVETTLACRVNLERRMGHQLDRAVLDDLLIPTYSQGDDMLFEVDMLQRIVSYHLEFEVQESTVECKEYVGRLLESCIAEMASDPHLSVADFITLVNVIPEHYKLMMMDDGMYRAVDIYLKTNPCLSDMEKRKVFRMINCQRLSKETCAHAAQNERLPVQFAVQVLFYEQQRLQAMISDNLVLQGKNSTCSCSADVANIKKENGALKLENMKQKKKMDDMEKRDLNRSTGSGLSSLRNSMAKYSSPEKPSSLRRKPFINSTLKGLGWFYPFVPIGPTQGSSKEWSRPRSARRNSMS